MRLRAITAFGLCLFLALTSVTLAVARGTAEPAGVMVLCTGGDIRTVPVDSQGRPTGVPHVCPDCLLALYAEPTQDLMRAPRIAVVTARHPFADAQHPIPLARPAMLARAPPAPA
jgi:hypothetical protein